MVATNERKKKNRVKNVHLDFSIRRHFIVVPTDDERTFLHPVSETNRHTVMCKKEKNISSASAMNKIHPFFFTVVQIKFMWRPLCTKSKSSVEFGISCSADIPFELEEEITYRDHLIYLFDWFQCRKSKSLFEKKKSNRTLTNRLCATNKTKQNLWKKEKSWNGKSLRGRVKNFLISTRSENIRSAGCNIFIKCCFWPFESQWNWIEYIQRRGKNRRNMFHLTSMECLMRNQNGWFVYLHQTIFLLSSSKSLLSIIESIVEKNFSFSIQ